MATNIQTIAKTLLGADAKLKANKKAELKARLSL